MELYERQQFDLLMYTAVERFVERVQQRNGGSAAALHRLRESPEGEGIWLSRFVEALFQDFALDNVEGACFVLVALAKRPAALSASSDAETVETILLRLAKHTFAALLQQKAEEALERAMAYSQ